MSVISLNPQSASPHNAALLQELSELNGGILLTLLGTTDDSILLVSLDGSIAYANDPALDLYEAKDFAALEGKAWAGLWPSDDQERITALIEDAGRGISAQFESKVALPGGRLRWLRLTVDPVPGLRVSPSILLVTLRDTTDAHVARARLAEATNSLRSDLARKEALLKQKAVLSAAVDHRVKNSLALVSGMLRMQERAHPDPFYKTALRDAAARVATVAEVHAQVTFGDDVFSVAAAPFLSSLMTKVADAHPGLVVLEEGHIAEVDLSPQKATALGLIATELLTHALVSAGKGDQLTVTYDFTLEDRTCLFTISDTCTELPRNFSIDLAEDLSFRICRTHAAQLGGALTHSPTLPRGATFNLAFRP